MRKSFIHNNELGKFVKRDRTMVHNKWIKKGDHVLVISGNHRGAQGEVLSRTENYVIVRDVNLHKKHQKRQQQEGPGVITEMEMPIHVSNVSLHNAAGKAVRIRARVVEGRKELYYMDGDKEVLHRKL